MATTEHRGPARTPAQGVPEGRGGGGRGTQDRAGRPRGVVLAVPPEAGPGSPTPRPARPTTQIPRLLGMRVPAATAGAVGGKAAGRGGSWGEGEGGLGAAGALGVCSRWAPIYRLSAFDFQRHRSASAGHLNVKRCKAETAQAAAAILSLVPRLKWSVLDAGWVRSSRSGENPAGRGEQRPLICASTGRRIRFAVRGWPGEFSDLEEDCKANAEGYSEGSSLMGRYIHPAY